MAALDRPAPIPLRWKSGAATDRGRVRAVNQDAFLDRSDLGLWAVADGMGGHSDGALASQSIVEALGGLTHPRLLGSGAAAVREKLQAVNQRLLDRGALLGGDLTGSTVVVLLAVGGRCAVLWVGDSRAYRLRGGELTQLTSDHSQVQVMVDSGVITSEQADDHPSSNVLLRAVGSDTPLEVDGRIERPQNGDRYLLCSDGLFRELNAREIAGALDAQEPDAAAQSLVQQACEHGGRDNVTALVVTCLAADY